jgi:hypothetical protein
MEEAQAEQTQNTDQGEVAQPEDVEVDLEFDFDIDPTGEKAEINGFNAERTLMTLTMDATATDKETGETGSGTLIFASEMWMTRNISGYKEVEDFNVQFAKALGQTMMETKDLGGAIQQAFAGDPRVQEGLAKMAEEADKLEGVDVRSTTKVVALAEGHSFDTEMAFAEKKEEKKKKKGGLGAFAKGLAAAAAGVNQQEEQDPKDAPPQTTLLTMTSELETFNVGSVDAGLFSIPKGYKQMNPAQ